MSAVNVTLKSVFDDKGIKQAQKSFQNVGGSLKKLGGTLAAAFSVAAITNFASGALKAAEAAQVANNRLDQIASSMGIFGNQASVVTGRLKEFADQQMMVIGQDDELIKSTQAKLLTFKQLAATAGEAGGAFDRATIAAFDLAAAGFGSAETNAVQLGKALQDPIKGLTALTRSGVTFTKQEKDKIKTLVESGKTLEAQDMILKAIEQQVGGTAEATVTGFQRIKLAFGEAQEVVGNALLPVFEKLVPVITSLAEKFAPVLARVMESLGPIFETIVNAIDPLLTALEPLFDIFVMVADVINDVLLAVLPVLTKLLGFITPILKQLAEAFLPLIQKLLPVFGRLLDALMPFIEILADYLTYVLIPALEFLADIIGDYLVFYLEALATAFELIGDRVEFLWDKAKPFFEGIFGASQKGLQVTNFLDGLATAFYEIGKQLGPLGILLIPVIEVLKYLSKKTAPPAIPAANSSVLDAYQYNLKVNQPTPLGLPNALGDELGTPDPSGVADRFAKVQKVIKKAQVEILKAERDYERTKFEINREYEDKVYELRKTALEDQEALIKESQSRITSAFRSATQMSLGDLFSSDSTREIVTQVKKLSQNLTLTVAKETEKTTYSSVTDIINGLRDRLTASKNLLANASRLAGLGFKQTFIEQVLETGTETGNALAGAILDASPETQSELRNLFGELETVSETGADSLAKNIYDKFKLATRELAAQSATINEQLDLALIEQNKLLLRSLGDAAYAFQTQVSDIKSQFLLDLDEFDGAFAGLGNTIDKLIAKFEKLLNLGKSDIQAIITAPSGDPQNPNPFENAAITEGIAIKDIANGAGIVIDELSDVAGAVAYLQARIEAGNKYIKNVGAGSALGMDAQSRVTSFATQLAELQNKAASGTAAGTVVNINVRTDTTQSQAMVGKTIGKIVTKYVTTGGQVLVSGN
jgi:phage-related protein